MQRGITNPANRPQMCTNARQKNIRFLSLLPPMGRLHLVHRVCLIRNKVREENNISKFTIDLRLKDTAPISASIFQPLCKKNSTFVFLTNALRGDTEETQAAESEYLQKPIHALNLDRFSSRLPLRPWCWFVWGS